MKWVAGSARVAAAFFARSKTTIAVFTVIWAVGLGALAIVVSTQANVENQLNAQLASAAMQQELGDLTLTAFGGAFGAPSTRPSRAQVTLDVQAGLGRVTAALTTLERFNTPTEYAPIVAGLGAYYLELARIGGLLSQGNVAAAGALFGNSREPGGSYGKLVAGLRALAGKDSAEATYDRNVQTISETVAFVFMLLAFSGALYHATRLARQKHELLERSQVDALTDKLTGLPNRRKLFADMEALLSESPPPDALALGMFDLNGFKNYNDTFGHPAGDALLSRLGHKLAEAISGDGSAYRMGGDEFCVIARGADAEGTLSAAAAALDEGGDSWAVSCSYGSSVITPDGLTLEEALQQADQRLYDNKRSVRNSGNPEAHDVLLRVLAEHDVTLASHLTAVGRLAEAVARQLGLPEDEVTLTRLAAELHDVGKTAIPDAILNKPGPLDPDEWTFMKRHTIIGERILAAAPALAAVAPLVRSSHERPDGTGYPDGLRENEIPVSSRIVAVVDAYDAMTHKRPYSPALTPGRAIAELRRCAGSQFDPAATEALITVLHESVQETSAYRPNVRGTVAA